MELNDLIKQLRIERGVKSRELSERLGKGSSYISQIEGGRNKNLSYQTLKPILEGIGLTKKEMDDIFDDYNIERPGRIVLKEKQQNLFSFLDDDQNLYEKMDECAEVIRQLSDIQFDNKRGVLNNFHDLIVGMANDKDKFDTFVDIFKNKL